jgi:hypothetical protein
VYRIFFKWKQLKVGICFETYAWLRDIYIHIYVYVCVCVCVCKCIFTWKFEEKRGIYLAHLKDNSRDIVNTITSTYIL